MSAPKIIGAALALTALYACTPKDEQDCSTEARASVQLTLRAPDGAVVSGALVTVEFDDGSGGVTSLDCEEWESGEYVCGYEVVGELRVTVSAEGFEEESFTYDVEMTADECHVQTVTDTLTLTALDCTEDSARWAMQVTVTAEDGAPLSAATVQWGPDVQDDVPYEACEPTDAIGDWLCGLGESGDLLLLVEAEGFAHQLVSVAVPVDECGQTVTQALTVALAAE
ncbi:carboxypeptidase-like regulatory domain-containing protein [Myxococcota bacterium]|nr:carboxypeptidase-like regulatory domain-containing protein [Myxococcota bacterium]